MYPLLAPGFDSPKIKLSSRLTPQPITIKNGSKQGSYTFGALPIFFSVPNAGRFSNSHFFLSPIARSDKSGQYKIFEQWRLCQLRNPKFDYFGQNHFLDENDFVVLGTILDTQNQIDCIPKIQKQIDYYFDFDFCGQFEYWLKKNQPNYFQSQLQKIPVLLEKIFQWQTLHSYQCNGLKFNAINPDTCNPQPRGIGPCAAFPDGLDVPEWRLPDWSDSTVASKSRHLAKAA